MLRFVNNLRVLLICLVILHHVAGMYSGLDAWYCTEKPTSAGASLLLTLFMLINQAWFMGAFFFLAGCFTPASVERKGRRAFLRDRLIRLGIPFVVFYFVVNPLLWRDWHGIGSGPLWFVLALLVFDTVYALRPMGPKPQSRLRYRWIVAFVVALALATWLVRIVIPIGFWVPVVDFPTAAYLPQYAAFFAAGIVAGRRGWLTTTTARLGWAGLAMAAGATLVFLPLALAGGLSGWLGRGTASSLWYALWDSTFAVGLLLALLTFFRARLDRESPAAPRVYAVYVLHAIVVTAVGLALAHVELPSLAKFAVGAAVAVPACFLLAGAVRRLPGVRRVL